MTITEKQYERLPQMLKEIVDNDQQRAELRKPAVISFEAAKGYRKLQVIRGELRRGAAKLWGQNLNKNAATAKRSDEGEESLDGDGIG